jgi:hypothetical protein
MDMQTGPAPRQSMRSWLLWTGVLELINVVLFFFVWLMVNWVLPGTRDLLSILGMLVVVIILIEGGVYWLLARGRFFQRAPAVTRLRLLRGLYGFNILLVLAYPLALIISVASGAPIDWADVLLGGAFYLFGLGEFLHYFVFKINMRPYELRQVIRTGKTIPARFLRELQRARRSVEG